MKKSHLALTLIACLFLLPLNSPESAQLQPFDLKKCQQELEVMKGILRTTLNFAAKDLASRQKKELKSGLEGKAIAALAFHGGEFSGIKAFYLSGQGAVFLLPASSLRDSFKFRFDLPTKFAFDARQFDFDGQEIEHQVEEQMKELEEQMGELQEQLGEGIGEGVGGGARPVLPPKPPKPAAVAAPPAPPSPVPPPAPKVVRAIDKQKSAQKKLAELQERFKKRQAEQEVSRAKFQETLAQLKVFLVETLANHGDSMTTVKSNEFINLVISGEGGSWPDGDSDNQLAQQEIISVQKSVVTDYKAGKLTLDAFKQKVTDYVN